MSRSVFLVFLVVGAVSSFLDVAIADDQLTDPQLRYSFRSQESELKPREIPKDVPFSEEISAMRGVLSKFKPLFRNKPSKVIPADAKLDKQGAHQAFSKLKSIVGLKGRGPTKLTPEKMKALETYARDNPEKWSAMSFYLFYVEEIAIMTIIGAGAVYLALRPVGTSGAAPK
ncbi:hypothetical protein GN244_ATG17607 [Phytophthora infestans]|uniref:Secreted RxLR effector peptide protein n=1 Tax=Phytophthora infestans TaxID=4787 RepID=A0A833SMZ2_PHYIN|nr:hypothetical protein GN244_ATG17607 [Phytophthora infestans]